MVSKLPKFNDLDYVHFITTNTWEKIPYFRDKNNCLILLNNIYFYQVRHQYKILAYCIMSDHVHLLIGHCLFEADGIKPTADGINPSANQNNSNYVYPSANQNDISHVNPSANQNVSVNRLDDGFILPTSANGINPLADRIKKHNPNRLDDGFISNKAKTNNPLRLDDGFTPSSSSKSIPSLTNKFIPSSIEDIIHDIKGKIAVDIRCKSKIKNKIWQKSFYDFPIYSQHKLEEKIIYIHNNPVRAGLVEKIEDYPWSSFNKYES